MLEWFPFVINISVQLGYINAPVYETDARKNKENKSTTRAQNRKLTSLFFTNPEEKSDHEKCETPQKDFPQCVPHYSLPLLESMNSDDSLAPVFPVDFFLFRPRELTFKYNQLSQHSTVVEQFI